VTSTFPPRRLLAVAAAVALFGGQVPAGQAAPAAGPAPNPAEQSCPLGSFHCAPRPLNYAMCRPNALLEFYDPTLSRDSSQRATAPARVTARHVDSADQSVYHLSGDVLLQRGFRVGGVFSPRIKLALFENCDATPEEVANMSVYAASPQASATTGAALRVEGGIVESIA